MTEVANIAEAGGASCQVRGGSEQAVGQIVGRVCGVETRVTNVDRLGAERDSIANRSLALPNQQAAMVR